MEFTNFLNGGKKSICINLKHPEGVEIIGKLINTTDIVLEPFRPGKNSQFFLVTHFDRQNNGIM